MLNDGAEPRFKSFPQWGRPIERNFDAPELQSQMIADHHGEAEVAPSLTRGAHDAGLKTGSIVRKSISFAKPMHV